MPLKDQFGQKLDRDVMYYHKRIILRFEKNGYSRQSCRLPNSTIRVVVFWIWISPRIQSQNRNGLKSSLKDLGQSDLCKNLGKFGSLPCPFKEDLNALHFFLPQTHWQINNLFLLFCFLLLWWKLSPNTFRKMDRQSIIFIPNLFSWSLEVQLGISACICQ